MPQLSDYIAPAAISSIIQQAVDEDLGPNRIDVTSQTFIPETLTATAHIIARKPGILCGAALLPQITATYDPAITLTIHVNDGSRIQPQDNIVTLTGPLRSILPAERIALNFVTHLSGVATLTDQFVQLTEGTSAKICDTRKTIPGLRGLQKYAVACGGGTNHRIGLYDAVLIKDNHLAHLHMENLSAAITEACHRARAAHPNLKFVQVEVDTLEQLVQALTAPVDIVLLDNMPPEVLQQAVAMRNKLSPTIQLEASGNVNLQTTHAIAEAGVDRISIGALTHSAPSLDFGLDIHENTSE
ncbi:carboxylating nicotinate-nucleotide diphosphorylase [Poriferisphaera sp. WC338]|uniref:carboxylating nicotinate-nucleotide diphosphorylase n=1 Tax=Poriferisphaera sp. WC338 TaxID=3425129 RepID=UPI003D816BC3